MDVKGTYLTIKGRQYVLRYSKDDELGLLIGPLPNPGKENVGSVPTREIIALSEEEAKKSFIEMIESENN